MDLKVGVEKDGAAVGAKLFQKRSWKERALAFANNGFRQPLGKPGGSSGFIFEMLFNTWGTTPERKVFRRGLLGRRRRIQQGHRRVRQCRKLFRRR
ncbi:hypothetical protein ES288_D09G106800v1 [Gossypium darwinii]|uniref:Uncharacterized protein n=1 Tax=Gossypium darwinii TaxID=34276 RepID=A0A5D2BA46_GOSDA|nr:hypothetical protein ES288_D09G106800v1 [Gossypium darwinii]